MIPGWALAMFVLLFGFSLAAFVVIRGHRRRRNRRRMKRPSQRSEIQELAPDGGLAEGEEVGGGD